MTRKTEGTRDTLQTRTTATLMGAELVRTRTTSVMDPVTGRALEFWEQTMKSGRHYVFGPGSYTVQRLKPPKAGPDVPVSQWVGKSVREFALPESVAGGPATGMICDPYGMLASLGRQKLEKPGDEVVLMVASSHGPEPYRIRVTESRLSQRSVVDAGSGANLTHSPIRELRLRVSPANPNPEDEGFMKMEGDTEIWVEASTRTLLEIEGTIPRVPGRVEVLLKAVGQ